jgi:hypothetical protein
VLSFGIITPLAGIAVLAWPGETLLVIAVCSASSGDHLGNQRHDRRATPLDRHPMW